MDPLPPKKDSPPKESPKPMRIEENTSERRSKEATPQKETPGTSFSKPAAVAKPEPEAQLSKAPSKDKIQVFDESDDEEIDKHLAASRQNLRDPMEKSEASTPPTPEKVPAKIVEATGSSVQLTEGALKDAKSYVQVLYDRNHNLEKQLNVPFDYGVKMEEEEEYGFKDEGFKKRSSNNLKRKNSCLHRLYRNQH